MKSAQWPVKHPVSGLNATGPATLQCSRFLGVGVESGEDAGCVTFCSIKDSHGQNDSVYGILFTLMPNMTSYKSRLSVRQCPSNQNG